MAKTEGGALGQIEQGYGWNETKRFEPPVLRGVARHCENRPNVPSQVLVARNTKFNLKLMEETSCRSARSWHVALRDGMVFLSPNRLSSFPSRTAVAVCGARLQTAVCNEQQTLKAIGATPSRFEFETFSIPASDITMLERKFGICERFQRCSG
jgi:hypothetical protein